MVTAERIRETESPISETQDFYELWKTLTFEIEGMTPLLQHNPAGNLAGGSKTTKLTKQKEIPTPEEEAALYTYRNADGTLVLPAVQMRSCLLGAASRFAVPKKRYSMKIPLQGALQMAPGHEDFPLYDDAGEFIEDYSVDSRRAVVNRQGILRSRPMIDVPWRALCHFALDATLIDPSVLEPIIATGGRTQGVGDFRPATSGWFGTFRLVTLTIE